MKLFLILVVAAGVVVFLFVRFRQKGELGFKDLVRNPGLQDEFVRERKEIDTEIERAKQWTDGQIEIEVEVYLFKTKTKRDAWGNGRALEELGERVHAPVLKILENKNRHSELVRETGKDLVPEAPFNRACDLLGEAPPLKALELVAPFLDNASEYIRKDAALVIGKIGALEIMPFLRKAFADAEEDVATYALMGLQYAVKTGRLAEDCRKTLFPELISLLKTDKYVNQAPELLIECDIEQAKEFFLHSSFFKSDSRFLHQALKALAERKIAVPQEKLLALILELEKGGMEYPKNYNLAEALHCLGQNQRTDNLKILEKFAKHADSRVAEGAAQGLLAFHSIERLNEKIWEIERQKGYKNLALQMRHWIAVSALDGEVNNGGLSQYFFNSSGDNWRDALAGLQEMGLHERATILKEAIGKFSQAEPSEDRDARQEQLAKLSRKNDAVFDELDDRYYNCDEVVEVGLTKYAIQNAAVFK